MRKLLILLTSISMIATTSCTTTPVASSGSGTGTGNPIVIGVVTANDQPVANARVTIRRESETSQTHNYNYLGREFDSLGAVFTDENGEYRFTLNDTGTFIIEITGDNDIASLKRIVIEDNDTVAERKSTLLPLDTIRGKVSFWGEDDSKADLYVYGTDHSAAIDESGDFEIVVPSGLMQLLIVPESDDYLPWTSEQILSTDELDEIMILAIEPKSYSYTCDSLIVRAILDSNNLTSIAVDKITTTDDGRIEEFDVNPDFTNFGKIDVSGYISVIPSEIGGLLELEELEIQYTSVTSLPESIGNLVNIEELELNNNQLTTLPESFVNLKPTTELDLKGNKLQLSDELSDWASKYSPGWEDQQLD